MNSRHGVGMKMRGLFATSSPLMIAFALAACPPAERPCRSSRDCAPDEGCFASPSGQVCQPRLPVADAGVDDDDDAGIADAGVDAGDPAVDAGFPDEGARTLRGTIEVGAGTSRGGNKELKASVLGVGQPSTSAAGAITLERTR